MEAGAGWLGTVGAGSGALSLAQPATNQAAGADNRRTRAAHPEVDEPFLGCGIRSARSGARSLPPARRKRYAEPQSGGSGAVRSVISP